MKLFYLVVICIWPIIGQAQVDIVKEQIENSYKHYEDAIKEIKFAIGKLEICEDSHSVDGIKSYASDAYKFIDIAKKHIDYAKDKANNAKEEASDINCQEAKEKADGAKRYFHDTKDKLSSALRILYMARYKSDLYQLRSSMSDAKNYIDQAVIRMNLAVNELRNAHEGLEVCN